MLSYSGIQTQAQDLTADYDTESLTFLKNNINIGQRILETELGSFYTEELDTVTTVADTASYKTPVEFIRLKKAYITSGTTQHVMDEVFDEEEWRALKSSSNSGDILQKIFIRRDNFEVYPTPATADLTITLIYEAGAKELIADDYTTGTITTLANASKAVTASGSTFTTAMAGRYLRITNDGVWYKIATYGSATTLTLDKAYEGLSIAAGSEAFTIGQMPITPESTHHIPAYYAAFQYYLGFKQDQGKAKIYRELYEIDLARAKRTYGRRYSTKYISGRKRMATPINSNYPPSRVMA
jgi:hypothetical protein